MWITALLAILVAMFVAPSPARSQPVGTSDWPTAAHDVQRSGYTAHAPAPPYRVRWVWADGEPLGEEQLQAMGRGAVGPELLPDHANVRFMNQAQPMAADGTAYIGSVEGEVFAIDVVTGQTKWRARASGPVLHSVTIAGGVVYVATARGVDAFDANGRRLWTLPDPHLGGFKSCPAVCAGVVLAGGIAGYFYGIDAQTGKLEWEHEVGAPIYHTPAVQDRRVYFGAEDMHAYALDAVTGARVWRSERLAGVSFGPYWPVIAPKEGVVMFRTASWGGTRAGLHAVEKAPFDYDKAQDELGAYFDEHPHERSFFVLNLSDGREEVRVVSGYFGVSADLPPPPVVRDDGAVLQYFYAKEGAMQKSAQWGAYGVPVDFGRIDFASGRYRRIAPTGTTKPPTITRNDDFHQVSLGGRFLFGLQVEFGFGCVPLDGQGPDFHWYMHRLAGQYKALKKQGKVGLLPRHNHGSMGPTVLGDVVLVNPAGGTYLVAFESEEAGP